MVLLLAWVVGCDGGKLVESKDSDPPATSDTGPTSCVDDDGCDGVEICNDAGLCELGDRNNSIAEAQDLLFNDSVGGVIQSAGDVDYFRFETFEAGQWVQLQTTHEDGGEVSLDTVIRLYRANGQEYAWADNYDQYRITSADSSLVAWLPNAGQWIVSVEDVGSYYALPDLRGSRDFAYELSLTDFTAVIEEGREPMVVALESGTRLARRGFVIKEPGDVDEITLQAPYDDVQLQVTGGRGLVATDLTLSVSFEIGGEVVMAQPDLNELTYGMVLHAQADDYTVRLTDRDGGGSDAHWFVVVFRTFETSDPPSFWGDASYDVEVEPNDTPAEAIAVDMDRQRTSGGTAYEAAFVEGFIDAAGDVDAYRVPVTEGNNLTVRCYADRVGSTSDLVFEVRDADGAVLESVDSYDVWSAPQLFNFPLGAGRDEAVVTVHDAGDTAGPAAFYRCQFFDTDFDVVE